MNLDTQQETAVKSSHDRTLIIAGPGSGKTRTLTSRIEYLINDLKTSPHEIMSMSFTRAASNEIKDRLWEMIGEDSKKAHIGTMHSLALRYIRQYGDVININASNLTVYNETETELLLQYVAHDVGILKEGWTVPKHQVDKMFNDYYQAYVFPSEEHPAYSLFMAFRQRCQENNALTYGDLLIKFYDLIPELSKHLNIKHILVDEVQDIDTLQWGIIQRLISCFKAQLFCVGDLDQSIFSWRGAVPDYIIANQEFFSIYELINNYRSEPDIINAANQLIKNNRGRIEKDMIPAKYVEAEKNISTIYNCDSQGIVETLKTISHNNTVVLSRNHIFLRKLSRLLRTEGISHKYIGRKSSLINSNEFITLVSFLKLLVNKNDNFAFMMVYETLGISDDEYAMIRFQATSNGISHFNEWMNGEPDAAEYFRTEYANFDEAYYAFAPRIAGDINQFNDVLSENYFSDVREFLDWITTYDISEETSDEWDGLKLMTIHSSKGLEFETVIMVGLNEGVLPSKQSLRSGGDIEAERRLMYVGITRAEKMLFLTVRPTEQTFGERVVASPESRFIKEMME